MRIHHLNCGTMCPLGGKLMDGFSHGPEAHLVCHCLLIESRDGLVLVDTGIGMRDIQNPEDRIAKFFRGVCRPRFKPQETAIEQIKHLGFSPRDVRHIVITHLDFDHAGGIEDFPNARVHIYNAEYQTALEARGFINQRRYRPMQFDEVSDLKLYDAGGEKWFGFDAVRDLYGLPPEILMVPLIGHTWGHCGVAVDTGSGWLLHAGDAYFNRAEMNVSNPSCPPGERAYQKMMEVDRDARLTNQTRLRELIRDHGREVKVFSAHDAVEWYQLAMANTSTSPFIRQATTQDLHLT